MSEESTAATSAALQSSQDYALGAKYWATVAPTIDGMLGGFASISPTDIEGSNKFLKSLFKLDHSPGKSRALDCGAGIGRITKHLLQLHFDTVDLVEQNPAFLEQAHKYLEGSKRIGHTFCSGLQDFKPESERYDVIWCQWVLGHLTDEDLVAFFKRCSDGIRANGLIVVKENVTSSGDVEKDEEDASVTRPLELLRDIFHKADLKIIREMRQQKFPTDIYPVYMFALKPRKDGDSP